MAPPQRNVKAKGDEPAEREAEEANPRIDIETMKLQVELARIEAQTQMTKIEADKAVQMARLQAEENERERGLKEKQLEAEIEADKAVQRARLQAEEHEREMFQLRLQEMQLRAELGNLPSNVNRHAVEQKRFPRYQKGDDVEAFLFSYERSCRDLGVEPREQMMYLRPQICGGLSEIYAEMRDDETSDYELFKERVRVRYGLTAEQSRKTFREIKRKQGETWSQLGCRLDRALTRWIEGSKITTLEGLKNLISLEQFYNQVPYQYRWILKDKHLETVEKAASVLDEIEGDLGKDMWMNTVRPPRAVTPSDKPKDFNNDPARRNSPPQKRRGVISCFQCGELGHIQRFCGKKESEKPFPAKTVKVVKCVETESEVTNPQTNREEALPDKPAYIMSVWNLREGLEKEYLEPLTVNDEELKAYRDTGAQITLIQPSLVQKHQLVTGKRYTIKGIHGPAFEIPVAEIPVKYKSFQGTWTMGVLPSIEVPVLLGNDLAAQGKGHEDSLVNIVTRSMPSSMETPAEEQRETEPTLLQFVQAEEFLKEQREDVSLQDSWLQAEQNNQWATVGKAQDKVKGPLQPVLIVPAEGKDPAAVVPVQQRRAWCWCWGMCFGLAFMLAVVILGGAYLYKYFSPQENGAYFCGIKYIEDGLTLTEPDRGVPAPRYQIIEENTQILEEEDVVPISEFADSDPADIVHDFQRRLTAYLVKTYAFKHPNDWDQQLQHLLFGYREMPQESTGFSPFELLFGRQARGPLDILKAAWTGGEDIQETDVITYLQELQEHLQQMRTTTTDNMQRAQRQQKISDVNCFVLIF